MVVVSTLKVEKVAKFVAIQCTILISIGLIVSESVRIISIVSHRCLSEISIKGCCVTTSVSSVSDLMCIYTWYDVSKYRQVSHNAWTRQGTVRKSRLTHCMIYLDAFVRLLLWCWWLCLMDALRRTWTRALMRNTIDSTVARRFWQQQATTLSVYKTNPEDRLISETSLQTTLNYQKKQSDQGSLHSTATNLWIICSHESLSDVHWPYRTLFRAYYTRLN